MSAAMMSQEDRTVMSIPAIWPTRSVPGGYLGAGFDEVESGATTPR